MTRSRRPAPAVASEKVEPFLTPTAASDTVVLTDDVNLYTQVWFLGNEAINFNHLRQYGG